MKSKILKNRYIYSVIIAIAVLVCNQIFIQYWLAKKDQDARVINISGRQRMLSQKINLEFYRIKNNDGDVNQLKDLFAQWQKAHNALLEGDKSLDLEPIENKKVIDILHDLEPEIKNVSKWLSASDITTLNYTNINKNQEEFLFQMNNAVNLLEKNSHSKLRLIISTEVLLMLISILVIILEVRFIFLPFEKKMVKNISSLSAKNKQLREIAWQQSHEVRRPLANAKSLIEIIKKDKSASPVEKEKYIKLLSQSMDELDEVVTTINANTEDI